MDEKIRTVCLFIGCAALVLHILLSTMTFLMGSGLWLDISIYWVVPLGVIIPILGILAVIICDALKDSGLVR